MEFAVNSQPCAPNSETAERLLANLRQTHLEISAFNNELDAIAARIEHDVQQQKLVRTRRSHLSVTIESNEVPG